MARLLDSQWLLAAASVRQGTSKSFCTATSSAIYFSASLHLCFWRIPWESQAVPGGFLIEKGAVESSQGEVDLARIISSRWERSVPEYICLFMMVTTSLPGCLTALRPAPVKRREVDLHHTKSQMKGEIPPALANPAGNDKSRTQGSELVFSQQKHQKFSTLVVSFVRLISSDFCSYHFLLDSNEGEIKKLWKV